MQIIKEFREFALKGSVVDLAVGIIIGGAFQKIVSSLVNDIIMPPIGVLMRGIDFKNLKVVLAHGAANQPDVTLNYGMFIQTAVEFLIIAVVVFFMVKSINRLRRKQELNEEKK
jgi:large conductance mechanosensitive channel